MTNFEIDNLIEANNRLKKLLREFCATAVALGNGECLCKVEDALVADARKLTEGG